MAELLEPPRLAICAPNPFEHPRNDFILRCLRFGSKGRSRLATLQQHSSALIVCLNEFYCGISVPEAQSFDFVLAFHVRHREFEHCRRVIPTDNRSDPRTGSTVIEWRPQ